MGIGKTWDSEVTRFQDVATGVEVLKLTNYKGNSYPTYFTNNFLYDNQTKLVFCSDRDNRSNLFSLDLKTFQITQLTDLVEMPLPYELQLATSIVDPIRNVVYYGTGKSIQCTDLHTLESKTLYNIPDGFTHMIVGCAAGSQYVYTSILQDLSSETPVDLHRGFIGFREVFERHPESRIIRIRADGSGAEEIRVEHNWIGHINVSPVDENRITFCHEGPWELVDNRIWGMDVASGEVWKIRPTAPGESIGHEYWYGDGLHIGYHGQLENGQKIMGKIRFDNTEREEVSFNHFTGHIHSVDDSLIVGDGYGDSCRYVRLWKRKDGAYPETKALCQHFSSFKTQEDHVHPCLLPDQKHVIFASDRSGYTALYMATIPDYDSLPDISQVPLW